MVVNLNVLCKVQLNEIGKQIWLSQIDSLPEEVRTAHPEIHIGWYSGRAKLSKEIDIANFDYIKLGPYIEAKGGLNKSTTNQRLYKVKDGEMTDITDRFWKK